MQWLRLEYMWFFTHQWSHSIKNRSDRHLSVNIYVSKSQLWIYRSNELKETSRVGNFFVMSVN